MELTAQKPGMIVQFDDFDQLTIREVPLITNHLAPVVPKELLNS
jgi:hypothetical protein